MPLPLIPPDMLDATALDYEDMMTRARTLVQQACPYWRDHSSNFIENVLLEACGFMINTARITMEQRSRQSYWSLVSEMRSVIRLGRANSFIVAGYTAATIMLRLSVPSGTATRKVPILEGLRIRAQQDGGGPRYRVMVANELAVGSSYVDVSAENAEVHDGSFESTGDANQEVILAEAPYIDGSIVVSVSGVEWDRQISGTLTMSRPESLHYVTKLDDQNRVHILFGNGINGSIPARGAPIATEHKTGDGTNGEVSAGAVWLIEDTVYDDLGQATTLVVSNPSDSSPADSGTTVDQARVLGPIASTTRDTAVDEDDFENVAISVSGIARAAMVTSEQDPDVDDDYGLLYLVARGSKLISGRFAAAAPTVAQIAAVEYKLSKAGGKRPLMLFSYDVRPAVFRTVTHSVKIYKASNYSQTVVAANIRAAVADFYAVSLSGKQPNPGIDFGFRLLGSDGTSDYTIAWSDLFEAIKSAAGVRRISHDVDCLLLNDIRASVTLLPHEWAIPGAVTIYDMDESGVQI